LPPAAHPLHGLVPGRTGYNEFRALLTVPLVLNGDAVSVRAVNDETPGWPAGEHESRTSGGGR
jgi:hypothetical protein